MDPSPSTEYHTTARRRYKVACGHCRKIRIRCIRDSHDPQGRCTGCIRLKKECNLKNVRARGAKLTSQECSTKSNFTVNGKEHVLEAERGRTQIRDRATSPNLYSDNERTRSQSPPDSFYHDDPPARNASTIGIESHVSHSRFLPLYEKTRALPVSEAWHTASVKYPDPTRTAGYQYTSLSANEIRLLRITPGPFDSPLLCSLKIVSMERIITVVHEFQALSYAWGNDPPSYKVLLNDLPRSGDGPFTTASKEPQTYAIRRNLYQALRHIRLTDDYLWLWVDALCIDQTNNYEKSQQIPKLPSIYSNAWNVIAWLGDGESLPGDFEKAVSLVPDILNLKTLDIDLRGDTLNENVLRSWASFGSLLQQPWFERRWVIQEVACARKLSVRVADKILSWLDFADAVDLYSANIDRMRLLYQQSALFETEPAALDRIKSTKAVALMRFSRNVFRKCSDPSIVSRLMNLESLVMTASSFAVSDIRDVVYALLYLANDGIQSIETPVGWVPNVFKSDYSKHPVRIFEEFVNYSIETSRSLEILCRPWASWPGSLRTTPYEGRTLPTYIKIASFDKGGPCQRHMPPEDLLGPVGGQIYDASRGVAMPTGIIPQAFDGTLNVVGMILGTVEMLSASPVHNGMLKKNWLAMLGWGGTLETGIDDGLWRTLVANRDPESRIAPTWYRRACALALTSIDGDGHLNSAALIADKSQPSTLISYLQRVLVATENKKVFCCTKNTTSNGSTGAKEQIQEAIGGLGPEDMESVGQQWVCILYGSSVPVILKEVDGHKHQGDGTRHVTLTGPCYVHGYMEGEIFAGMSKKDIQSRSMTFSIH